MLKTTTGAEAIWAFTASSAELAMVRALQRRARIGRRERSTKAAEEALRWTATTEAIECAR